MVLLSERYVNYVICQSFVLFSGAFEVYRKITDMAINPISGQVKVGDLQADIEGRKKQGRIHNLGYLKCAYN